MACAGCNQNTRDLFSQFDKEEISAIEDFSSWILKEAANRELSVNQVQAVLNETSKSLGSVKVGFSTAKGAA